MSKTAHHLQLQGFTGGADFDRNAVDNILEKNQGKQVNVLIDSTGGNLATGLSITSVFKNHGNVDWLKRVPQSKSRSVGAKEPPRFPVSADVSTTSPRIRS